MSQNNPERTETKESRQRLMSSKVQLEPAIGEGLPKKTFILKF